MSGFFWRLAKEIILTPIDPRPAFRPKIKPGLRPPKPMILPNFGYPSSAGYLEALIKHKFGNKKLKHIDHSEIVNYLADFCEKLCYSGDCEQGIELALEAIKKFPKNKEVFYYWLGLNYLNYSGDFFNQSRISRAQKELKNAENALLKALSGSSSAKNAEIFFCLGIICERQESTGKAIKYYKKAISKEPDFEEAKERLNECLNT